MTINVLVLSAIPWNTNNNFGSSYSGIFTGIEDLNIYNVFLNEGQVNDKIVKRSFEISERRLINNLFHPEIKTGIEKEIFEKYKIVKNKSDSLKSFGKRHKIMLLYLLRDLLWRIGKWDSKELDEFIKNCSPKIMFLPINGSAYPNRIALKICSRYNLPIIGYISDDNYTLKVFSISPLFWIRRLIIRQYVGKVIRRSKYVYVISQKQKETYDKIFGIKTKILTKGVDINHLSPEYQLNLKGPIKMVYTGGLGIGRWKSIAAIAKAMQAFNKEDIEFQLDIYSPTELTKKMKKQILLKGVNFCGEVPSNLIPEIQANADVLVHVEATDMLNRWSALYGFSTKIVDYMISRKAIIAFGDQEQASINYLNKNGLAFVASDMNSLTTILKKILDSPDEMIRIADKAYFWVKKYHNRQTFQNMIEEDIIEIID